MPQNLLYGENFIVEHLNEFKFEISADSFFQTNSIQALNMYEYVRDECNLSGSEIIYDFYCGTGTISIFVAKNAKKVYGFEIVESAIKDAKKNALKNKGVVVKTGVFGKKMQIDLKGDGPVTLILDSLQA